jgi:hypothetical protein
MPRPAGSSGSSARPGQPPGKASAGSVFDPSPARPPHFRRVGEWIVPLAAMAQNHGAGRWDSACPPQALRAAAAIHRQRPRETALRRRHLRHRPRVRRCSPARQNSGIARTGGRRATALPAARRCPPIRLRPTSGAVSLRTTRISRRRRPDRALPQSQLGSPILRRDNRCAAPTPNSIRRSAARPIISRKGPMPERSLPPPGRSIIGLVIEKTPRPRLAWQADPTDTPTSRHHGGIPCNLCNSRGHGCPARWRDRRGSPRQTVRVQPQPERDAACGSRQRNGSRHLSS